MSSYNPPIENLGIFDSNVFNSQTDTTGSIHFLDNTIQTSAYTGAKSLQGSYTNTNLTIDANGKITALANGTGGGGGGSQTLSQTLALGNSAGTFSINMSNQNITNLNSTTFTDTSTQNSAYTGAKTLQGSYTNTNMTIDANGKITALSNGVVSLPSLSQTLLVGNSAGSNSINMNSNAITSISSTSFTDSTTQVSAYTGAKTLQGSYTNTNMTIDANGKITALSNGSGGGSSQTLSQTLALGNSAGIYNIDLSGNQLQNCSQITASADLTLNPVGSISCNGKTLDMTNGEIHNTPLIHSQTNQNITIEGKGTGLVILKGNNANTQIQSTGLTSVPTIQVQDTTTAREVDIYTNNSAANQNPIVQVNDTSIVGKGTTLTNGVIDIATNSATTSGVRITNNTALIGAGGSSSTPSHYFQSDPSNNLNNINGNTKITGSLETTATITSPASYGGYNLGLSGTNFYTANVGTQTNFASGDFDQDKVFFSPFYISKDITISTFATRQGGGTGTTPPNQINMAMYTNNNGVPETLLANTSFNLATAATNQIVNLTTPISVKKGYYWSAFYNNSTTLYPTNLLRGYTNTTINNNPDISYFINLSSNSIYTPTWQLSLTAPNTLPSTINPSNLTIKLTTMSPVFCYR